VRELAQMGYWVTGVDLSLVAIEKARRLAADSQVHVEFIASDLLKLQLGARFTFVFDYLVFHHIRMSDWAAYSEMVSRHLRPGGHYAVVCSAEVDRPSADGRVRIGKFGNTMTHPTRADLEAIFLRLELRHAELVRVTRTGKHIAHHLVFQAPLAAVEGTPGCRRSCNSPALNRQL
jgi:2-polyprenyl-3-methyl-5-hydroxy-6-metoxy-1,4-benzoquinol methylase